MINPGGIAGIRCVAGGWRRLPGTKQADWHLSAATMIPNRMTTRGGSDVDAASDRTRVA